MKYLFDVNLTKGQTEIVRTIAYNETNRVVICCMTRYGKSLSVSIGVLLYLLFNENKKIIIIAPTYNQTSIIRNYLVEYLLKCDILRNLLPFDVTKEERLKKEISKERITFKDGNEIRTLTAGASGEGLMGFGGDMIICDEDCLIDYEVFRSKISRMFGDNPNSTYISIGNPWNKNNQMWENWVNPKFKKIHINYKQALEENRVSKEFIEEQKARLTETEFKILYEAEFPDEAEDQLFKREWIDKSLTRDIKIETDYYVLGVDVARLGIDYSVLTLIKTDRKNYEVVKIKFFEHKETMQIVGEILKLLTEHKVDKVIVDTTGIGAGVTDRLNELKKERKINQEIIPFMSGETSKDTSRYLNKKSEAYFRLRNLFENGNIKLINEPRLINELLKMRWELTSSAKVKIIDPEKSPDFADSLCYAVYDEEAEKPRIKFG